MKLTKVGIRFWISLALTGLIVGCGDPNSDSGILIANRMNQAETIQSLSMEKVLVQGKQTFSMALNTSSKLPIPSVIGGIPASQLCAGDVEVQIIETKSQKVEENLAKVGVHFKGKGCATKMSASREIVGKYSLRVRFNDIPASAPSEMSGNTLLNSVEYQVLFNVVSKQPAFSFEETSPLTLNSGKPFEFSQNIKGELSVNNDRDISYSEALEVPKVSTGAVLSMDCHFIADAGSFKGQSAVLDFVKDKCPLMVVGDSKGRFFARFHVISVGFDENVVGATSTYATYYIPKPKQSFWHKLSKIIMTPEGLFNSTVLFKEKATPTPNEDWVTLREVQTQVPSVVISRIETIRGVFQLRAIATNAMGRKSMVLANMPVVITNNDPVNPKK